MRIILPAFVAATLVVVSSWAQGVPSAVAILPAQNRVTNSDGEMETGRYEKRVQSLKKNPVLPRKEVVPPAPVNPDPVVVRPIEQAASLQYMTPTAPAEQEEAEEASVGDQVRDLVIGGSGEEIQKYKAFVNPDDIRRNLVELEIAPSFIYNESKSEHWLRSHHSATPGGRLGLNVWFTPFFGISTSYQKTFLGTLQKQFNSSSQTPFMDQWLRLGVRFRRFSSYSLLSPSLTLGLDYMEFQHKLPIDDPYRNSSVTTGMLLSAEARMPSSEFTSWNTTIEYMPFASHREQTLGTDMRSGLKAETFHAGFAFGPEFKLSRTNRLFVRGRVLYEKNSFSGQATTPEPSNGQTPENVSVSNTFTQFEVGYIWGN